MTLAILVVGTLAASCSSTNADGGASHSSQATATERNLSTTMSSLQKAGGLLFGSHDSPAVRRWFVAHNTTFSSLVGNIPIIPNPVNRVDGSKLETKCNQLAFSVRSGRAIPGIPNAAAERYWLMALSQLGEVASNCKSGLSKNSGAILRQAQGELKAAANSLSLLVFGVPYAASHHTLTQIQNFKFRTSG